MTREGTHEKDKPFSHELEWTERKCQQRKSFVNLTKKQLTNDQSSLLDLGLHQQTKDTIYGHYCRH